jgi:hypothetical protein
MRLLVPVGLAVALLVSGCGEEEESPPPASSEATTSVIKPGPDAARTLPEALKVIRSGDQERLCDLYTVGFLYFTYSRRREAATKYCRFEARRDGANQDREDVEVKLIGRSDRQVSVSLALAGGPALGYVVLVNDGRQWLVNGIGDPAEFPATGPVVKRGVSSDELEGFLGGVVQDADRIDCEQVPDQDLGEWECALAASPDDGPPRQGGVVLTIGLDGSVAPVHGYGNFSGVGGCCLDLETD